MFLELFSEVVWKVIMSSSHKKENILVANESLLSSLKATPPHIIIYLTMETTKKEANGDA